MGDGQGPWLDARLPLWGSALERIEDPCWLFFLALFSPFPFVPCFDAQLSVCKPSRAAVSLDACLFLLRLRDLDLALPLLLGMWQRAYDNGPVVRHMSRLRCVTMHNKAGLERRGTTFASSLQQCLLHI